MLSRRNFLGGASALALTPLVERILNHHEHLEEPLLMKPPAPRRVFYMHRNRYTGHDFQIVTDALSFPRRLVEHSVIEETFGPGSFRRMTQRDHWRLIDEGRFSRDQTIQPSVGDGFYGAWAANYSPHSEAVGLLEEIGLGPTPTIGNDCGLTFENCGDDDGRFPAVYCDTTKAISLLQAELLQRGAAIEVRFEERIFPEVTDDTWRDFLRNGGNVAGL